MKTKSPLGTKECRVFSMPDLRAVPEGSVIDGHAAVFGQRVSIGNWFYEVIERGAFDKTDFRDVLFCINHDMRRIPLARSRNNNQNSTLQLSVDDKGLAIKATLDVERNAEAKALYSAVDRGDMGGMSFMFRVNGEFWKDLDSDMPTRHITDIARVIEVTAASFPAYDGTDINARDQHGLESPAGVLESARSRLESQKNEQAEIRQLKDALLGRKD